MKKMFAAVLLTSVAVVACAGKKPSAGPTTPDKAPLEKKEDATGGAAYGHRAEPPAGKDAPAPR
jgi:hypothetical protein